LRVLVLGGDGYLGWPTALKLAVEGHHVFVVDNCSRRKITAEMNVPPLIEPLAFYDRVAYWNSIQKPEIECQLLDVLDYQALISIFKKFDPEVVIHYAEQPSAPYSMLGHSEASYTLKNNLLSTLNLAYAVKETNPDIHILKLGTMGEYGTPNIDIEEGYLDISHKGRTDTFLFPRQASSLYHTTKIQDTDLLYLYVRTWQLRVTDLMQGPVYGMFTREMSEDPYLFTLFNYDHIFGTVLNRFVVQAAIGRPIAVYGAGTQRRGFLNLIDTIQCVSLAVNNPPQPGQLSIFNQFTEVFSVLDLAEKVKKAASELGCFAEIEHVTNPRVESESHYYNPSNTNFDVLGLKPHKLNAGVLKEMLTFVIKHKAKIKKEILMPNFNWR
jgi:UDP-sulfoquinovose synthase